MTREQQARVFEALEDCVEETRRGLPAWEREERRHLNPASAVDFEDAAAQRMGFRNAAEWKNARRVPKQPDLSIEERKQSAREILESGKYAGTVFEDHFRAMAEDGLTAVERYAKQASE